MESTNGLILNENKTHIMKKKALMTGFFLALISMASVSFAQTRTPRINHRQANQQRRIAQGVKSGELNRPETARLESREAKIQNDKKEAKSDGVVTPKERAKLRREENRTSRAIHRQKHDEQVRH